MDVIKKNNRIDNLLNNNQFLITEIITFYILNKFINGNYSNFYYYFSNVNIFIIHIIINNGKYDLIFNEDITPNYNKYLCTFTIKSNKEYIIFEKYDYVKSINLYSKFIKKLIKI